MELKTLLKIAIGLLVLLLFSILKTDIPIPQPELNFAMDLMREQHYLDSATNSIAKQKGFIFTGLSDSIATHSYKITTHIHTGKKFWGYLK